MITDRTTTARVKTAAAPGEDPFGIPPKQRWWEVMEQNDGPKKLMSFIYWQKSQLPPTDKQSWLKNWQSVVKQLQRQHPAPAKAYQQALAYRP